MNNQGLVNEVITELYKRLHIQETSAVRKRIVTIGGYNEEDFSILNREYEVLPFQYGIDDYYALVICTMSTEMLASLAVGSSHRLEDSYVLEALLQNKPVYILDTGWQYRAYKDSAPKALYSLYCEYEKRLLQFGIIPIANVIAIMEEQAKPKQACRIDYRKTATVNNDMMEIDLSNKKLLLESDLISLSRKGLTSITISKGCIITPLAQDIIKNHNIQIIQT